MITAFNLIYYIPLDEQSEFFSLMRSLLSPNGCFALANTFQSKGIDAAAANLNLANCSFNKLNALPKLEDIKTQLAACGFNRLKITRFMPKSEFYGITAYVL